MDANPASEGEGEMGAMLTQEEYLLVTNRLHQVGAEYVCVGGGGGGKQREGGRVLGVWGTGVGLSFQATGP